MTDEQRGARPTHEQLSGPYPTAGSGAPGRWAPTAPVQAQRDRNRARKHGVAFTCLLTPATWLFCVLLFSAACAPITGTMLFFLPGLILAVPSGFAGMATAVVVAHRLGSTRRPRRPIVVALIAQLALAGCIAIGFLLALFLFGA